jgi:hypothetical protein
MATGSTSTRLFAALAALIIPIAASAGKQDVGQPSGGGAAIEWQVKITGQERIELTVLSPDGEAYFKEFGPGRNPSFRLLDLGGNVADGQYNYELRVVPRVSDNVKKQLLKARQTNDEAAARKIMKDNGLSDQLVQSGSITILNGTIVSPDVVESDANDSASADGSSESASAVSPGGRTPATNASRNWNVGVLDQVIPDDLIVQQSLCVGFDCVNGESFGFDTLRLKENNLRIHFDDTSSSAGFPANDWRIVANDSGSGGSNFLAIEDSTAARNPLVVEAGATANSLFVDSTGRIGLRQSAPVLDLHITTTNTPAVRLEQTNGGGFTAQTWDIGGNEANFFVRDVTGGSRLSFRIRPGAPTSSVDIAANGNVGIGTASPAVKLDVQGTTAITGGNLGIGTTAPVTAMHIIQDAAANTIGRMQNTNATGFSGISYFDNGGTSRMYLGTDNAGAVGRVATFSGWPMVIVTNNVERVRVDSTGNVGVGTTTPSSKLHVNGGDIRVSGGSFIDDGVTLNAPDYVFDESYKLMSLDEVNKFISENKHLPNVPSAKEIKTSGLNMSQFQMRLLEKVEELTLYTLAQHEQIGGLKEQNEELQKRLEQLESQLTQKQ